LSWEFPWEYFKVLWRWGQIYKKLFDIVQIRVCSNHGPLGSVGATIRKAISYGLTIEEFSQTFRHRDIF
jgi:hypothetical protein